MPTYPDISSQAFKHPLDQQAEQALRSVPGFDLLAKSFSEYLYERPQQILLMGNDLKVSPRQYATLYGIYRQCLRDLDMSPEPNLYVSQNPSANAYSLGSEHPYIVLNTALLDLLDEEEIRVILAHELGHLKCDHSILIQMSFWVMGAANFLGGITLGLGKAITTGLVYAFYEWRRKAELSADRAALLVSDDLNLVLRTLMKCAGGSQKYLHECNLEEFIRQGEAYRQLDQDNLNQIYKFLIYNGGNGSFLTHPFSVERVHYLQEWFNSESYRQIRRGNYAKTGVKSSINVDANDSESERLQRQIAELQAEIERAKRQRNHE
ncbi:Peptidase M48 Ste24p [Microcystis aeruginosa PCC 9809]|jgi:Zn-dependent protease with chaperone function|uniref:Peptidase M48 Ste24p n=1 Tax=Microcystis aeruginosa PCC 9809 TaxID=1160285 RepID=I4HKL2_MICAE|nr:MULTISPECIES: M48 family metallopeptidase [Microcystis]NCR00285.1 M48 family metallopeptidase [Microcystis aeruginosa L211-11]NCR31791.1 M48 family metallopeptidase [Microcystis aeruginosa L211-101]REJ50121.1 MAG: M48 family peptidase [Microcystis flos-aquae DF17]MDJ0672685.1 M48 family metallopeptidase [Microcystis sp. M53598_WE2]CCI22586.1 Peptidase M48 Ste24p [Microcystis aeruginosa PCC 9809]